MPIAAPNCSLCRSCEADVIYERLAPQRFGDPKPLFGLIRCKACGLVYLSPCPEPSEMQSYYPPSYYFTLSPGPVLPPSKGCLRALYDSLSPSFGLRRIESKLAIVRRYFGETRGRVLDIGVGDGDFLDHLGRLGWRVEGTDFSAEAARLASTRLGGITVRVGSIEELDLEHEQFDLITLWDVLEHLYNPLDALRRIHSLLKPGGLLIISVPNFASLESRLLGRSWGHLDVPRHLTHFTSDSLAKMLESSGFRELRLTTSYNILAEHMPRAIIPWRIAMDGWITHPWAASTRILDDFVNIVCTPLRWIGLGSALVAAGRP